MLNEPDRGGSSINLQEFDTLDLGFGLKKVLQVESSAHPAQLLTQAFLHFFLALADPFIDCRKDQIL